MESHRTPLEFFKRWNLDYPIARFLLYLKRTYFLKDCFLNMLSCCPLSILCVIDSLLPFLSCASWSLQCSPDLLLLIKQTGRHRSQRSYACKWRDQGRFSFHIGLSHCVDCWKLWPDTPAWSHCLSLRCELRVILLAYRRRQRCLCSHYRCF